MNPFAESFSFPSLVPLLAAGVFWLVLVIRRLKGMAAHVVVDWVLVALALLWSMAASLRFYPKAGLNEPLILFGKPYFVFPGIWWVSALAVVLLFLHFVCTLGDTDGAFSRLSRVLLWALFGLLAIIVFSIGLRLVVASMASMNMLM